MSAHYKLLQQGKGVQLDCQGNLTSADLFETVATVFTQIIPDGVHFQIIDLSDIDSLEIPAEHLLKLAQDDRVRLQTNPDMKLAFVTGHDVVRSVVFMWRGYINLDEQQVRHFATLREAYDWVGYEEELAPA